jgi:hypothetical protein
MPQVPQPDRSTSKLTSPVNLHEAVETIKGLIRENELLRVGGIKLVAVTQTYVGTTEDLVPSFEKDEAVLAYLEAVGLEEPAIKTLRTKLAKFRAQQDQQEPNEAELAAGYGPCAQPVYPLTAEVKPFGYGTLFTGRTVTLTPGQRTLLAQKSSTTDSEWAYGWMPTQEVEILEVEVYGEPHKGLFKAVVLHSRQPAKAHTRVLRTFRINRVNAFLSRAAQVDANFEAGRSASGKSASTKARLTPELSASLKELLGL